jgi:hypothetical protein
MEEIKLLFMDYLIEDDGRDPRSGFALIFSKDGEEPSKALERALASNALFYPQTSQKLSINAVSEVGRKTEKASDFNLDFKPIIVDNNIIKT